MAEEANLTIVINARDNASAALAGVESAVAKLQSAEQKSVKTGQESDKGLKSIGQTALETAKGISNTVQEFGGFVDGLGKIKQKFKWKILPKRCIYDII